jgi:glutamine amidotransferase
MRERFLEAMSPSQRAEIGGATDSEHLFRLLLSLREASPERTLLEVLHQALGLVREWMEGGPAGGNPGLNVIWTDGRDLVASRWGRTLHLLERDGVTDCEICGFPHVHHEPGTTYRAVVLASEPLTHTESWREIPDGTLIQVDEDLRVRLEPWAVPRSLLAG